MFVVTGVTGHTGSAAAETLLAAKLPVRVVVRDEAKGAAWRAKGADVAIASFEDPASMTRALAGADGAYVLLPPPAWNQSELAANRASLTEKLLTALRDAAPKHTVFLSSVGAQHKDGTGPIKFLHPIELALRESGLRSTLLRAAFFMENWGGSLGSALESGKLYYGLTADKKFAQVATKDIGATAAKALIEPHTSGTRVIELAGPEDLSLEDTAAVMSRVSAKPVTAVSVPVPAMVGSLEGMGASKEIAAGYGELVQGINADHVAFEGGSAQFVRGTTTLESVLRSMLSK
ncbi:MAG: NmrA family NAD(P)-binding protein [Polyangiales bacterium]